MSMPQNRLKNPDYSKDQIRTVQAQENEVNINQIVKRIQKGQFVPEYHGEPFYGDVSEFSGLQDAIIKAQDARDLFMQYPPDLRERFDNDPVKFVEFFENPDNMKEAITLGLAVEKKAAEPPKAPAVPEQPAK